MLLCQVTATVIAAGVAVSPLPSQGAQSFPWPGISGGVVRSGRQSWSSSRLSPALPRGFFCHHDKAVANASLGVVPCCALPKGMAQQHCQLPSHGKMENFLLKMFLVLFFFFSPVVVCSLLLPCLWHQVESQSHEVTSSSCPALQQDLRLSLGCSGICMSCLIPGSWDEKGDPSCPVSSWQSWQALLLL